MEIARATKEEKETQIANLQAFQANSMKLQIERSDSSFKTSGRIQVAIFLQN